MDDFRNRCYSDREPDPGERVGRIPLIAWLPFSAKIFFNNVDALAIGCAASLLSLDRLDLIFRRHGARPHRIFVFAAILVLIPQLAESVEILRPFPCSIKTGMRIVGPTLQSCGIGILILHSVILPGWGVYRLLNFRLVAMTGVISYSLHLWQQPFWTMTEIFNPPGMAWYNHRTWFLPSVLAAVVSYQVLERPFLKLRRRFR
jgi:peptidoglycan/LPS O-acetylase OafA/YrhL